MLVARQSADFLSATRVIVIIASLPYDFPYSIAIDKNELHMLVTNDQQICSLLILFNRSGPSLEGQTRAKMKMMLLR